MTATQLLCVCVWMFVAVCGCKWVCVGAWVLGYVCLVGKPNIFHDYSSLISGLLLMSCHLGRMGILCC